LIHVSELSAAKVDTGRMIQTSRHHLFRVVLGAAAVLIAGPLTARDHDHDQARRAVESAEALPLTEILARVRPSLGGEVISVSFERKRDRWVYEFKVIAAGGRLFKVYVDAASAEILKRKEQ
jgi:uncharacterized membrane protein YkoI